MQVAKKAAELHGKKQAYQASQKDYNHKEAAGRCWALYSAILVGQAYAHFEKQDSKKAEKAIKQALEAAQQAYKLHPEGKFSRHLAPVLEAEIEALERGRLTPEK